MSATAVAAEMLARMPRTKAVAKAEHVVKTRGGKGSCAAFWADVAAVLRASSDVGVITAPDEDVFSFSADVLAQMKRSA